MKPVMGWKSTVASVVVLICASWPALAQQGPHASSPDSNEYVIYGLIIKTQFTNKGFSKTVIQKTTATSDDWKETPGEEPKFWKSVSKLLPGVQADTLSNFKVKNEKASQLGPQPLGVFVTEEEVDSIFRPNADGWDVFYKKYPGAQGILRLSRVGFSQKKDQALVYFGNQAHWLDGAGYFVLLANRNGSWVVVKQAMIWIS